MSIEFQGSLRRVLDTYDATIGELASKIHEIDNRNKLLLAEMDGDQRAITDINRRIEARMAELTVLNRQRSEVDVDLARIQRLKELTAAEVTISKPDLRLLEGKKEAV